MSTLATEIAEKLIADIDTEDMVYTRSDKVDNLLQCVYEQKLTAEDIGAAVLKEAPADEQKKLLLHYANELIKYLNTKLTKTKMSGFRGQPQKMQQDSNKKLSKSEQFLEKKRKEKMEKDAKEKAKKSDGKVEKISLKDVGKEMQQSIEEQKELDKKIKSVQESTQLEHEKHVAAYQSAFELHAIAVRKVNGDGKNTDTICSLIAKMGDAEITSRQVALDKLASVSGNTLAQDALIAALKDKNILINVLNAMRSAGGRKCLIPLLTVIKEYPTEKDILFRGPAYMAVGEIINRMNQVKKNSGIKFMYSLAMKEDFEPRLKLHLKLLKRDLGNKQYRNDYFTPACIKWLAFVAEKVCDAKKKTVKVGFVNVSMKTDLSKDLKEFCTTLQSL